MKVELLEERLCNYADYTGRLADVAADWRKVTSRNDLTNRKDWEFVTMEDFRRKYAEPTPELVLDAACGREPLVKMLAENCIDVIATDLWEPAYLKAANIRIQDFIGAWGDENIHPMVMDSMHLQFNDNTFDASFSVSSVEHMGPEDGRHLGALLAVNELIRVTKPGGLIAFSTEFHPTEPTGSWFFSAKELKEFIACLTKREHNFDLSVYDGGDEKYGIYPIAFALRKMKA